MNILPESKTRIITDEAILRQVSRETTFKECLKLQLFDVLREAVKHAWISGVGLAAIQIGAPLRFAYYEIEAGRAATHRFLINPKIHSGKKLVPHYQEGCLSIPHKRFTTWRYEEIVYSKVVNGKDEMFEAKGFEAVIIQHEVDHMNGILCCNRTIKPVAPGRNDPCLCGSGKKYKKCCESKGVPI